MRNNSKRNWIEGKKLSSEEIRLIKKFIKKKGDKVLLEDGYYHESF